MSKNKILKAFAAAWVIGLIGAPAYAQPENEITVRPGEPPEIFPIPVPPRRVVQVGCTFDEDTQRWVVVFIDGLGSGIPAGAEGIDTETMDSSDLVHRSCARALSRLSAARCFQRSATGVGPLQINNLDCHSPIRPVLLSPAK